MSVRPARPDDLDLIAAIEHMAGERFRDAGLDWIADRPAEAPSAYEPFLAAGGLFVATSAGEAQDDTPVSFVAVGTVDGQGYVDEISVQPGFGRRGLGDALLLAAEDCARARSQTVLRLTTFRDVPWNAPWYARRGFAVVDPATLGPEMQAIVRRQADLAARAPRVAMERPLG